LSLLALAEGVSNELAASLGPVAFEWLKKRHGVAVATEWRLDTYFRGFAIRRLRSFLPGSFTDGVRWKELQDVKLSQVGENLRISVPNAIGEVPGVDLSIFDELRCAAQAFEIKIDSIEISRNPQTPTLRQKAGTAAPTTPTGIDRMPQML
jgi:hypothetical protein